MLPASLDPRRWPNIGTTIGTSPKRPNRPNHPPSPRVELLGWDARVSSISPPSTPRKDDWDEVPIIQLSPTPSAPAVPESASVASPGQPYLRSWEPLTCVPGTGVSALNTLAPDFLGVRYSEKFMTPSSLPRFLHGFFMPSSSFSHQVLMISSSFLVPARKDVFFCHGFVIIFSSFCHDFLITFSSMSNQY